MFLLFVACISYNKDSRFAGGGTAAGGFTNETGDTAGAGDTADTSGSGGEEGAPVLSSLTTYFVDIPNVGVALELFITFTDENDSIVGGKVYPTFTGSDGVPSSGSYDIGDYDAGETSQAFVEPDTGDLFLAVIGLDEADTWQVDAYVVDSAGKTSNTVSGTASPYEE